MPRKSLILTLVLTAVLMFISARLYVSQEFWENWDNKNVYLEVYNDGNKNNTLELLKGKRVIVLTPTELYNPKWMDVGGKGVLLNFKLHSTYTGITVKFAAEGNGNLAIIFRNFKWGGETRDFKVDYKNITVNGNKIVDKRYFVTGDKLTDIIKINDGEEIDLSFEVKKYFDLSDLILKDIDWYIFIIVFTLSFFLSYKVVRYLAKFKIQDNVSRIDIVFVFLFFVLLFVPMSSISSKDKSEKENRVLAQYYPLYNQDGINFKFGQQFEQWFNDRFFGREILIFLHDRARNKIEAKGNANVLLGRKGWLYLAAMSNISMFKNSNLFTDKELEVAGKNISNFVNEAKKFGVKDVYFYLSNDKESLYSEFYPSYIRKQSEVSRLEQLKSFVINNVSDVKIFNFKDDFVRLKETGKVVFCKTGTHMNSVGSFYEYKFLINQIRKDYPMINEVLFEDLNVEERYACDTDLYNMLKRDDYSKENFKNDVLSLKNKNAETLFYRKRFDKNLGYVSLLKNEHVKNNIKVLLISDSFAMGWRDYLAEGVSSLYHIFTGHGMDYVYFSEELDYIKQNIPDIIIVETTERFLQRFLNFQFLK